MKKSFNSFIRDASNDGGLMSKIAEAGWILDTCHLFGFGTGVFVKGLGYITGQEDVHEVANFMMYYSGLIVGTNRIVFHTLDYFIKNRFERKL